MNAEQFKIKILKENGLNHGLMGIGSVYLDEIVVDLMEQFHQSKVDAITDEMIKVMAGIKYKTGGIPALETFKSAAEFYAFIDGARGFKQKLKK